MIKYLTRICTCHDNLRIYRVYNGYFKSKMLIKFYSKVLQLTTTARIEMVATQMKKKIILIALIYIHYTTLHAGVHACGHACIHACYGNITIDLICLTYDSYYLSVLLLHNN